MSDREYYISSSFKNWAEVSTLAATNKNNIDDDVALRLAIDANEFDAAIALIDAGVFIRPRFYTPEKSFSSSDSTWQFNFFEKLLTTYNAICIAENLERPGLQTATELAVECGRWDMVIAIARKYKKAWLVKFQ